MAGDASEARSPYPGLSPFEKDDAEFFVGREHEVGLMWRKLTDRAPAGIDRAFGCREKFISSRGGPPGGAGRVGALVSQPGEDPLMELARPWSGTSRATPKRNGPLLGGVDPDSSSAILARWRERHEQILLIVDQFEELFTLNSVDDRTRFAGLLRRGWLMTCWRACAARDARRLPLQVSLHSTPTSNQSSRA